MGHTQSASINLVIILLNVLLGFTIGISSLRWHWIIHGLVLGGILGVMWTQTLPIGIPEEATIPFSSFSPNFPVSGVVSIPASTCQKSLFIQSCSFSVFAYKPHGTERRKPAIAP